MERANSRNLGAKYFLAGGGVEYDPSNPNDSKLMRRFILNLLECGNRS
jgi:hypothetical protein